MNFKNTSSDPMREALELIANTGMDARQCMETATRALSQIPKVEAEPDAYMIEIDKNELVAIHFKREDAEAKVRAWNYGTIVPVYRHATSEKEPQSNKKLREICLNWKSGVVSGQEAMFSISQLVLNQNPELIAPVKSSLSKRLRAEANSPHPSRVSKDDLRAAADEIDRLSIALSGSTPS